MLDAIFERDNATRQVRVGDGDDEAGDNEAGRQDADREAEAESAKCQNDDVTVLRESNPLARCGWAET
jgi:hypothetical protein